MVWKWIEERENPDVTKVGCVDCQPYPWDHPLAQIVPRINTRCSETLPILCIHVDTALYGQVPINMNNNFNASHWTNGHIALTQPVLGCTLTSQETADQICETQLGEGYRMSSFHDGYAWGFWAYGHLEQNQEAEAEPLRFWVYIYDKEANCWDSDGPPLE